jgi:hypothetical protein
MDQSATARPSRRERAAARGSVGGQRPLPAIFQDGRIPEVVRGRGRTRTGTGTGRRGGGRVDGGVGEAGVRDGVGDGRRGEEEASGRRRPESIRAERVVKPGRVGKVFVGHRARVVSFVSAAARRREGDGISPGVRGGRAVNIQGLEGVLGRRSRVARDKLY